MVVADIQTLKIIALMLLFTSISGVGATVFTMDGPYYGSAGTGAIYFDSDFEASKASWASGCIVFNNFNLASTGEFAILGFGADNGVTVHVSATGVGTSITLTSNATTTGKKVYIYLPDSTPTSATGANYTYATPLITLSVPSGVQAVVINFGSTTVFYVPQWVIDGLDWLTGGTGLFTGVSSVIVAFTTYFVQSAAGILSLIANIMTLVFMASGVFIYWFGTFTAFFVQLFGILNTLMTGAGGAYGTVVNVWSYFNFSSWAELIPVVAFVIWFSSLPVRSKKSGRSDLEVAIGDLQIATYLLGLMWDWMYLVFNFVFNSAMAFIGLITGK